MTIHTVVLTRGRRQGVAFGLDELGKPIRIWLMNPRAVDIAMERLEQLGYLLKTYARSRPNDRERLLSLSGGKRAREWSLR